jgi:hypothetical protein
MKDGIRPTRFTASDGRRCRPGLLLLPLLLSGALSAQLDDLPLRFTVEGSQIETPVEVVVERWTTPAERAALLEVLEQSDSRLTLQALEAQKTTGYVALTEELRFDLHYATYFAAGDGRRLILVADRPISRNANLVSGSLEEAMTIIDLTLDAAGNGSGMAVLGADAQIDEATGAVRIITTGASPLQLETVRRTD